MVKLVNSVARFVFKTCAIIELEARKLRHDPTELVTRAVQPALWLLLFGEVFTKVRAIPTPNNVPYIDFMAPGILAQSVLFIAIFSGMTIIWERDLGIVHKFLASPTPRGALALGKVLSAAVIVLCAATFAAFSLLIAFLAKTRERFMGIGQVLTMPFFFASNAIYPIGIMPAWLKVIARINPLTYAVDALRALMLAGGTSSFGLGLDFGVLILATAILVTVDGMLYPRAAT